MPSTWAFWSINIRRTSGCLMIGTAVLSVGFVMSEPWSRSFAKRTAFS